MTSPSLNLAVKDVLLQGCTFLDRMSDEVYARPLDGTLSSSLGAHYRHVLDHFFCLVEGIRSGRVNYDKRRRNPELECAVVRARSATQGLIEEFHGLTADVLQRECLVAYSVRYGDSQVELVRSNLGREVMFCIGHAIHHFAILKLLSNGQGVKLPYEFGIAPSTLRHIEAETASR
jgi:hypothetical protein